MSKNQSAATNPSMRQCVHFLNAVAELKTAGSFDFRCAIASLAIEVKQKVEVFQQEQQASKVLTSFEKEMQLHKEECTKEKDGKKQLDVEAYMEHFEKAKAKYKKDFTKSEELEKQANKVFDDAVDIYTKLIPHDMLVAMDTETKFSAIALSALLPFVEKK